MQNELLSALEKEQSNTLPLSSFKADDLIEKLKLLNYESYLREIKIRPSLSKFYFLKSTNPGEQFFVFISLCAWLIRKLGKDFDQPQEFDDPNETISKIIKVLQEMDIPTDFPSNKLIQGAGPICIFVLDCLVTQVLKISKISLRPLQLKSEEETVAEYVEDDAEIILEKIEEQNALLSDESDDDQINSSLDLNYKYHGKNENISFSDDMNPDDLNESESWRLELERVLPQLKVVVKPDPRDWRAHLKQMESYEQNIETSMDGTLNQLKKLQNDIKFVMDKVESREKHLNNEFQPYIKQFKEISIELSNVQAAIKNLEEERENLTKKLTDVINENDNVKAQMEQKGASMSDGSPVINIKKAIAKLKEEITQLNLEIGLLTHNIDQDITRQASLYAELENISTNQNNQGLE